MKLFNNKKKNKIFIEELKPEMTQCRIIQVEKNIKKKGKDKC